MGKEQPLGGLASLKRIIGAASHLQAMSFLPRGARAAATVARISLFDNGREIPQGTGSLVSPRLLPSLTVIGEQLWRYLANGELIVQAQVTLYRAFAGFSLALILGMLIGTLMARSRLAERLIEPIFYFGYPIPKIAL